MQRTLPLAIASLALLIGAIGFPACRTVAVQCPKATCGVTHLATHLYVLGEDSPPPSAIAAHDRAARYVEVELQSMGLQTRRTLPMQRREGDSGTEIRARVGEPGTPTIAIVSCHGCAALATGKTPSWGTEAAAAVFLEAARASVNGERSFRRSILFVSRSELVLEEPLPRLEPDVVAIIVIATLDGSATIRSAGWSWRGWEPLVRAASAEIAGVDVEWEDGGDEDQPRGVPTLWLWGEQTDSPSPPAPHGLSEAVDLVDAILRGVDEMESISE